MFSANVIPALHSLGTVGVHVLQSTGSQVSAGGIQIYFFLVFQLVETREKIICLVEVVGADAGCLLCVVGCPPGGGKGIVRASSHKEDFCSLARRKAFVFPVVTILQDNKIGREA